MKHQAPFAMALFCTRLLIYVYTSNCASLRADALSRRIDYYDGTVPLERPPAFVDNKRTFESVNKIMIVADRSREEEFAELDRVPLVEFHSNHCG